MLQGNPKCPKCKGKGFVYAESMLDGGSYCECVHNILRLHNMEKIWRSLSKEKVPPPLLKKAPLAAYVQQNLWVTAPHFVFRQHLKAVCYRQPVDWHAHVWSDADILDAWFGTAKSSGVKIFDLDIAESRLNAIDIPSLVLPYTLVILVLGVKRLPNKETSNGVLEAISYREHENLPTWVVDQPDQSILDPHHLAYSEDLGHLLTSWKHFHLRREGTIETVKKKAPPSKRDVEELLEEVEASHPKFEEASLELEKILGGKQKDKYKSKGGGRR